MKLLLYCTKAKPYLYHDYDYCYDTMNTIDLGYKTFKYTNQRIYDDETGKFLGWANCENMFDENSLNGKIVAECDFEVEEIKVGSGGNNFITNTLKEWELCSKSKLSFNDLLEYTKNIKGYGYAIHIKNLHIFDKPRKLEFYFTDKPNNTENLFTNEIMIDGKWYRPVNKAPQNMCKVWEDLESPRVLISIHPEWLCKILNGEKTIEVRKKVLKEMMV